ncbi:MAG: Preprotein translocase, SecE subunit [Candidatus Moranbacteria bacterium GW2011_GWE1_35_17]|nr:MAG: Preprotein translocase, SecE subunit [Candidatus Moranbacteria bacterium GW2011_GWE2_35_164]KKP67998.1 MAG: Preprotein translocase, SecE subunit [Candidatus Moranbacteria bacterium GW2011_GWE1_35_17]KKP83970.1 MAG: Preprotein translocase, SecE subunit [Candidatus Moranbacteria bacterium GW2011_GWF2_35_54]KKP84172.1 MAG: Preprotein translocase, SecE subunit [Candidatus Moranbacteria bacterium GW2011_GWF1_35_5]
MKKIFDFIVEAKAELLKVNWPTKKQTLNYTLIIIGVSVVISLFLGSLDYLFGGILKNFIVK